MFRGYLLGENKKKNNIKLTERFYNDHFDPHLSPPLVIYFTMKFTK